MDLVTLEHNLKKKKKIRKKILATIVFKNLLFLNSLTNVYNIYSVRYNRQSRFQEKPIF